METLVEHIGASRPLYELALELLQHVLARDGYSAFSREAIQRAALEAPLEGKQDNFRSPSTGELVVRVVRSLSESAGLCFADVAGQVLWRSRREKALQRQQAFKRTAEDTSWLAPPGDETNIVGLVQGVYKLLADAGKMKWRGWQRVISLILRNPVLQGRVRHADADRLFYNMTKRTTPASCSISWRDFKELLVELSETSAVHPHIVFIAVGSHKKQMAVETQEEHAEG